MIDKILRVVVTGVQAARSGLAACVFKSKPTKTLCRKGLSVALLCVSALSVTHTASATLITVEAGVVENTGTAVIFAPFDQGLGTLTGAQLTYSFDALYYFFNDGDEISADEWLSNARLWMVHSLGISYINEGESHGSIEEGDAQTRVRLYGEYVPIDIRLVMNQFKIEWQWDAPSIAGLYDDVHFPLDRILTGDHSARATVRYTYEAAERNSSTEVPEPSTLAIFALGMIGLASRRIKKQS